MATRACARRAVNCRCSQSGTRSGSAPVACRHASSGKSTRATLPSSRWRRSRACAAPVARGGSGSAGGWRTSSPRISSRWRSSSLSALVDVLVVAEVLAGAPRARPCRGNAALCACSPLGKVSAQAQGSASSCSFQQAGIRAVATAVTPFARPLCMAFVPSGCGSGGRRHGRWSKLSILRSAQPPGFLDEAGAIAPGDLRANLNSGYGSGSSVLSNNTGTGGACPRTEGC